MQIPQFGQLRTRFAAEQVGNFTLKLLTVLLVWRSVMPQRKEIIMFIIVPMLLIFGAVGREMGFQDGQQRPNDRSFFVSGEK